MRVPCVRFTVRRVMAAVAVVAVSLAAGSWAAEMRQRRRVFSEWAAYHAAAERAAAEQLETLPWAGVIRIHRFKALFEARRTEAEVKRQRSGWTDAEDKAADGELDRLKQVMEASRSKTRAWVAQHLGELRGHVEEHAGLRRKFEQAAALPRTVSSRHAHPPDHGFACGTAQRYFDETIRRLRSEGASLSDVLPDGDPASARSRTGPRLTPGS